MKHNRRTSSQAFCAAAVSAAGICATAFGHAGPRIYLDIQNGQVVSYEGPYPEPEDANGNVSTNPADYSNYTLSRVFPGLPTDETEQGGQPTAGVLPLSWDDDPLNFSTEFPGLQTYGPGSVQNGTQFSFNIAGELQWYNTSDESFEPISSALPTNTPLIAVNNDLGQLAFSSTGPVPGYLAFTYDGDPTDHEHLTFTICTPDDLADGFDPEDAPAGVYLLPLQLTSTQGSEPSQTLYLLFGDTGQNYNISQTAMENEMLQAIGVANATLLTGSANENWNGGGSTSNWSEANNWGGVGISSNAPLVFNGTSGLVSNNDTPAGTTYAGILFNSGAGVFVIGGNALTLVGSVVNNSPNLETINANMALQPYTTFVTQAGNLSIGGAISGPHNLTKFGPYTLTLSGQNTYTGATNVSYGALVIANPFALPNGTTVNLDGGSMQLATSHAAYTITGLNVNSGMTLDMTSNAVVIAYGSSDPISTIQSYLTDGYNGGWAGGEITSSAVASLNSLQSSLIYSIGYADGADGIVSALSSGEIEIMPTLAGDAQLRGQVNFGDFQLLAEYFGRSGTTWNEGNFTYGSSTNFGDFQLLAQNFGANAGGLTSAEISSLDGFAAQFGKRLVPNPTGGFSVDSVPEPGIASVYAWASGLLLTRRRKTSSGKRARRWNVPRKQ